MKFAFSLKARPSEHRVETRNYRVVNNITFELTRNTLSHLRKSLISNPPSDRIVKLHKSKISDILFFAPRIITRTKLI